jgi:hypothetical protein
MTKPVSPPRVSIGTLVTNVKMAEWGPGKVLELSSTAGTVHFRDLPPGSQLRRIGMPYLVLASEQSDPALDLVEIPGLKSVAKRKRVAPRKKKMVVPRIIPDDAEEPAE